MLKVSKFLSNCFRFSTSFKEKANKGNHINPLLIGNSNRKKKDLIKIRNFTELALPNGCIDFYSHIQNLCFINKLYSLNIQPTTKAVLKNCSLFEIFPTLISNLFKSHMNKKLIGLVIIIDSIESVFQINKYLNKYNLKIVFYQGKLNDELLKECDILIVYQEQYNESKDLLKLYLSELCFHYVYYTKTSPIEYLGSKSLIENFPIIVHENLKLEEINNNEVEVITSLNKISYEAITVSKR